MCFAVVDCQASAFSYADNGIKRDSTPLEVTLIGRSVTLPIDIVTV